MKKREGKVEVKKETFRLLLVDVVYGNDELNNRADNLTNYEEATPVIREYKTIIRSQKKGILNVVIYKASFLRNLRSPPNLWKRSGKLTLANLQCPLR